MVWVLLFGGIALAGLVMLISYAVWLAHKAADVMSEVGVLAERAGQLMDLLAETQPPQSTLVPMSAYSDLTVEPEFDRLSTT